jgi:hypothetical protein
VVAGDFSHCQREAFFSKSSACGNMFQCFIIGLGISLRWRHGAGPWTRSDSAKHINELELLDALFGLESFLGDVRELSVRLYLNNTTAICYINKNGGIRSLVLSTAAVCFTKFGESVVYLLKQFTWSVS